MCLIHENMSRMLRKCVTDRRIITTFVYHEIMYVMKILYIHKMCPIYYKHSFCY